MVLFLTSAIPFPLTLSNVLTLSDPFCSLFSCLLFFVSLLYIPLVQSSLSTQHISLISTLSLISISHTRSLSPTLSSSAPSFRPLSEEAATVLGKDEVLLARVMEWCEARDHAGVRGEANRLLAALIRHSRAPVRHTHMRVHSHTYPHTHARTHTIHTVRNPHLF